MNQRGLSSLTLLFILVLGIFILWEANEFITNYNSPPASSAPGETGETTTFCPTGETGNCNDSNDLFILTE
jgi:hypothetical protein